MQASEQKKPSLSLKRLKENSLVLFFFTYAFGYIFFSIYCYKENLGSQSAFDLQYCIAGIIPTTLIIYVYWLFYRSGNFIYSFVKKILFNGLKYKSIIFLLRQPYYLVLTIITIFIIPSWFLKRSSREIYDGLIFFLMPINYLIIYISANLNRLLKKYNLADITKLEISNNEFIKPHKGALIMSTIYLILVPPIYFISVYPNIPIELGGIKTKKCIIYSDKNIFPDMNGFKKTPVTSFTDTVICYYENDKILIYKKGKNLHDAYELNRQYVTNVKWLDN